MKAVIYHDFDARWRVVLSDADGDEIETYVLPPETDGVRSAVRRVRDRLRESGRELGELVPVDAQHDTWEGPVATAEPVH